MSLSHFKNAMGFAEYMKYIICFFLYTLALPAWAKDQTKFAPIEMATIEQVKLKGKNCPEIFLAKLDELHLIKAMSDSTYIGADKFKWDYVLTISLKDKRERIFLINGSRFQESGNWKTWSFKKKNIITKICPT